jgi:hypothetical protein
VLPAQKKPSRDAHAPIQRHGVWLTSRPLKISMWRIDSHVTEES